MHDLQSILGELAFFSQLSEPHRQVLAGCARNHHFAPGEYLFRTGEPADAFYVLRHGHVALDLVAPGQAPLVISTLGPGDVVGASWLIPPYRWNFDARAVESTRAVEIDAACLRGKCDADAALGYTLMRAFLPVLAARLQAARLQLLDVYGRR